MANEAVVLLPGIMGSVLKDGTEVIWPGSVHELLLPYQKMAQLLKDDLQATDVIRNVSISSQYDTLIKALGICGFKEQGQPPTLYVCPYDWRKDNALAAERLAEVITTAAHAHGNAVDLTLIAHSMGGLVSRYYLESGVFSARPGFANVKRLITLATPHRGAPMALQAALGQVRRLFLNETQVKTVANDPRFPSLYQLLPPVGEPFAWDEAGASRFASVDIYQAAIHVPLGLSVANLTAALQFHAKLDLAKRPSGVKYFFFAGTRHPTVSEVRIRFGQNGPRVRAEEREDAGDGTVPIWSASQSGVQMAPVGGEHGDVYKDGLLQQILAVLLGKAGVLAAALPKVELALRDTVVTPGAQTRAVLVFGQPVGALKGALKIVRVTDSTSKPLSAPAASSTQPVTYAGAPIDRLSLQVTAPNLTGLYRVQFVETQAAAAAAEDDLFVQAP